MKPLQFLGMLFVIIFLTIAAVTFVIIKVDILIHPELKNIQLGNWHWTDYLSADHGFAIGYLHGSWIWLIFSLVITGIFIFLFVLTNRGEDYRIAGNKTET